MNPVYTPAARQWENVRLSTRETESAQAKSGACFSQATVIVSAEVTVVQIEKMVMRRQNVCASVGTARLQRVWKKASSQTSDEFQELALNALPVPERRCVKFVAEHLFAEQSLDFAFQMGAQRNAPEHVALHRFFVLYASILSSSSTKPRPGPVGTVR